MVMLNDQMVPVNKHRHEILTSIINGIILPIDELICFKMVIAPPTGWGLMGHKVGNHWKSRTPSAEKETPVFYGTVMAIY